ncbi:MULTISPECIES: Crp/Fnr family transcriptional regulator [unclassified Shinella]|uniref:Crp/Fnr family transcriptional regulator n=1 Tax=unclassified Shinella TaxID=2643062 RepID=UPI00225D8629|nr:Crp/Fnr family transcriptional regulator [Shinella sp. YE25]MDC7254561.1 Crp/Fnr family transcriptional regulator [Shinella sp. YE25]CAI0337282.1 Crp/Fnr family transcriptional regulator [Rhizobiaceae bacterium]CAK7255777.1 Crp/Fnr family transcriptional regulator [Shinella sp. WSC3-e]
MAALQPDMDQNRLLATLPKADLEQIADDLEYVSLPLGTSLAGVGKPIEYVYFLTDGIGSVVVTTPEGYRTEAGIFGFDGYVPTSAIAGVEVSPHDVVIMVEGGGYRMAYDAFRLRMDGNRNMSKVMIRSIESFSVQLAYTVTSNAIHDIDVRLARWLLMCHDRIKGDKIHLTHDFIATMLAVRRPSVTTALHVLEGHHFIRSERGNVVIRDRPALQEYARDAYGKPEMEFERLMKDLF